MLDCFVLPPQDLGTDQNKNTDTEQDNAERRLNIQLTPYACTAVLQYNKLNNTFFKSTVCESNCLQN